MVGKTIREAQLEKNYCIVRVCAGNNNTTPHIYYLDFLALKSNIRCARETGLHNT